jgi:phosphatidylglycerophosphate synthase
MLKALGIHIYKNCANLISLLGLAPVYLLFHAEGFQFIVPFIIYNNIMDDLDGAVAKKLGIRSQFGANVDNICDAIAHSAIVIAVGTYFGGALTVISLIAAFSIVLRTAARIDPNSISDQGTQTNELLRHIMFILLIGEMTGLNLVPVLTTIFLMNSISMLLPTHFTFMIVHYAKTPVSMMWFNISLILAYWFQPLTYLIGAAFFITYIYSFSKALIDVGIKEWAHPYG